MNREPNGPRRSSSASPDRRNKAAPDPKKRNSSRPQTGANRSGERKNPPAARRRQPEKRAPARTDSRKDEERREQAVRKKRAAQRKQRKKAARKEQQRARRSAVRPLRRRTLILKLVTVAAVVAAIVVGITIFFKVHTIRVSGCSKYTPDEIITASGIEAGQNLLTLGKSRAVGRLHAELPYVGDVQIGIKLPDTVNIDITELQARYVLQDEEGKIWLTDSSGKLLEEADEETAENCARIQGLTITNAEPGAKMEYAQEEETSDENEPEDAAGNGSVTERAEAAEQIMESLSKNDKTGNVSKIDVTNLYDIQVWYGDKYQVLLSGPADLSYKVRYMTEAISKLEAEKYGGGVLDLSFREEGKAIFTPW